MPPNFYQKTINKQQFQESDRVQNQLTKSVDFLYTNHTHTEEKIVDTTTVASRTVSHRINVSKEVKDLCNGNFKSVKKRLRKTLESEKTSMLMCW